MYTITKRIICFNIFILLLFGLGLGAILLFQASYLSLFLQIALPIIGLALIIGNFIGLYYRYKFKQIIEFIHKLPFLDDHFYERVLHIRRMEFILGKNAVSEACKDFKGPLLKGRWGLDFVKDLIQKSGLRFLELNFYEGDIEIDKSWVTLRNKLQDYHIAMNHLSVTVSRKNIENRAIERFVRSLRDNNSPKKVSFMFWGSMVDISNIKPALECLAQTNITSLGLWGERIDGYQNIEYMLTMLPHIPKNIKELDLSVNVSYRLNENTNIGGREAQHVQRLVLNDLFLERIDRNVLTKILRLFPNVTEVKIVDDYGKPAKSKHDAFISNLMEERKALQKAQADELLRCFNGSSDVAKIAAGYLGLPVSAFASKSQAVVPPNGDQAGSEGEEEKLGPS